jgi:hypothetical protein
MAYTLVIPDEKLVNAIKQVEGMSFTALDFAYAFKNMYPDDWHAIVKRYGDLGETNRYTLLDYLSNRLEYYSQNKQSVLKPIPRFTGEISRYIRPVTEEEKRYFDREAIMVFHKR